MPDSQRGGLTTQVPRFHASILLPHCCLINSAASSSRLADGPESSTPRLAMKLLGLASLQQLGVLQLQKKIRRTGTIER